MTNKIDLRKELKYLYAPSAKAVEMVEVPAFKFVMIDGLIHAGEKVGASPQFSDAMTALYGMGMMSASLFLLLSREADHLAQLATEPVFLVSGFYFPIKSLNFWVAAAASIIPLTLGLDAMRQLVFTAGPSLGFLDTRLELGVLIVLCIAFLFGARLLLAYMERLAIREGRLTESRR